MKAKLTDTGVRAYQPRAAQYAIGDASCPGLCIRVTPKGIKTFAFAYRDKAASKVKWLTLGRYPDLSLAKSREMANDARKIIAAGGTPVTPTMRRIEAEKKSKTYAEVVELYYDAKLIALRRGHGARLALQRVGLLYGWNERPITAITDDDAAEMLHDIAQVRGKKAMANQVQYLEHAMFRWARQPGRKYVLVNPFADLAAAGGPKVERKRFLSEAEIRQVWRALDEPERFAISADSATALRLILTTAARPGMVMGMKGAELHNLRGPSDHGPHWSLPAERMKNAKEFITPLSGLAVELLRPHLKTDPDARLFDLRPWYLDAAARSIVAELKMERWTPHDLRRTAATILDREGYSLEQIGALLAHERQTVTRVYARWGRYPLRREMVTVIEQSLRETLKGGEPTARKAAAA
jgi:integrase